MIRKFSVSTDVPSVTSARVGIKTIGTSTLLHELCVFMTGWGVVVVQGQRPTAKSRCMLSFQLKTAPHFSLW